MGRVLGTVLVLALLAGCGGGETVTEEQLDAMGEEQVLAMGECQLQKLYEEEGQEGVD